MTKNTQISFSVDHSTTGMTLELWTNTGTADTKISTISHTAGVFTYKNTTAQPGDSVLSGPLKAIVKDPTNVY